METKLTKKALTLGHLVESVYSDCGKRSAHGILRLVIKAQWVKFPGGNHYVLSKGNRRS